jgi:predicted membrane-bound spermidine synthase
MSRPSTRRDAIHALFLLSGFAGLVHEVVWVRAFGNVFGNTVHSAALVTAVFMCGLGLGSYAAGRIADRHAGSRGALLAAYGGAEIAIGLLAMGVAVAVPRLAAVSTAVSTYVRAGDGFFDPSVASHLARYALAAGMLAPITALMGATLTLLIREVVAGDLGGAGLRVGVLYGVNTLGAAMGALATDFLLAPRLGYLASQGVAAAVNVGVGVAALALARPITLAAPRFASSTASASPIVRLTAATVALSGFAGMGMELVWFRFLSGALGHYRAVFSLLLAVILVGMWAGSTAAGYAHQRARRAVALFVAAEVLFVLASLGAFAAFDEHAVARFFVDAAGGDASTELATSTQVLGLLWPIALVVAAPAFFMGFAFPLANAHVQEQEASVGRRAGLVYLANTAGSVAGSLVVGFALLPRLGSARTVLVLGVVALVALAPLVASTRAAGAARLGRRPGLVLGALALVTALALGLWAAKPAGFLYERAIPALPAGAHLVTLREGVGDVVAVVETAAGDRALYTSGHPMSATSPDAQRYMRAFAHLPLLSTVDPRAVLVICFGVGNTLDAASKHPSVDRLEVADLSRNVLEHAGYFARTNHDVLRDPRLSVFVADGRQHLRVSAPGSFDLVTLEPPPIAFAGVSALYSREFYELARSRLKPGGYLTQWLPIYQVPGETALAMVRAFVDVFPASVLLSGHGSELILYGVNADSITFDLDRVEASLRARPSVAADLARVNLGTLTELVGTFVADADTMRAQTRAVAPITDDTPSMEFSVLSNATIVDLPAGLFRVEGAHRFCPRCFEGGGDPRTPHLETYLALLRAYYALPWFLHYTSGLPARIDKGAGLVAAGPDAAATLAASGYLRELFPD